MAYAPLGVMGISCRSLRTCMHTGLKISHVSESLVEDKCFIWFGCFSFKLGMNFVSGPYFP